MKNIQKLNKCKNALNEIWRLNRVHVSKEMSIAYRLLKKYYKDLKIISFKTGEKCGDWIVPSSWDVKKAVLKDPKGKVIANWHKNKLSLWTNSKSFKGKISKKNLEKRILSNPKKPEVTTFHFRNQYNFWNKDWGFSLPYKTHKKLKTGKYSVDINTSFSKGKLEMAEATHSGKNKESILFVGHFDHPQMCLDGLVGCLAGHELINRLKNKKTNLSYRMLSTVEIIGSVFYTENLAKKNKVKQAVFISAPGARQNISYQKTFTKNNPIDSVAEHVLKNSNLKFKTYDFRKGVIGNDEIAYDVAGVNIPCGVFARSPFYSYHTDLDIPSGISWKNFEETLLLLEEVVYIFENNSVLHRNFNHLPRLSSKKNNLYLSPDRLSGITGNSTNFEKELLLNIPKNIQKVIIKNTHKFNYLMNCLPAMCNGKNSILDIAFQTDLPFRFVENYINLWIKKKLITKTWKHPFK